MRHKIMALLISALFIASCSATPAPDSSSGIGSQSDSSFIGSDSGKIDEYSDEKKTDDEKSEYIETIEPTPEDGGGETIDLTKFRLKDASQYSSIGYASVETETTPAKKTRVKRLLAADAETGEASGSQDIAHSYMDLLKATSIDGSINEHSFYNPFYLVGEKESGETEVLELTERKESSETVEVGEESKLNMALLADGDQPSELTSSESSDEEPISEDKEDKESSEESEIGSEDKESSSSEESSSEETDEEGESSGAIRLRGMMDLGEFVALAVKQETESDGFYELATEFPLFMDEAFDLFNHDLERIGLEGLNGAKTYLMSKKTGNIYYAGSTDPLGLTVLEICDGNQHPWRSHSRSYADIGYEDWEGTMATIVTQDGKSYTNAIGAGSRVIVGLGGCDKTLICEEVDGALSLRTLGSCLNPRYVDKYGNVMLDDGARILGADMKLHKIASYLNGGIDELRYNHGLELFYANVDSKTYVMNGQCDFVEYEPTPKIIFQWTSAGGDGDATFAKLGGATSYSEDGVAIDYYSDIMEDGDPIAFPIDSSKPYSWAPAALKWLSLISSRLNRNGFAAMFPDVDIDALKAKLIEGKCAEATEAEITYMLRCIGDSSSYKAFETGEFNDDGIWMYDDPKTYGTSILFARLADQKKIYSAPAGVSAYMVATMASIDGDSIVGTRYQEVDGYGLLNSVTYISASALRDDDWYIVTKAQELMRYDIDDYTISKVDTGDVTIQRLSVVDGNIQVTGEDEYANPYTGYIASDDTLSLEKVDLGTLPSCILYPVN